MQFSADLHKILTLLLFIYELQNKANKWGTLKRNNNDFGCINNKNQSSCH